MREKQIIFLDVDGVLNCLPYCERTGKELNPENIQRLKEIVDTTGAEIILSSTWKHIWNDKDKTAQRMKRHLASALKKYGLSISGLTPNTETGNRPEEIYLYLRGYKAENLDDDYRPEQYRLYHLEKHLVSTNFFCRDEKKVASRIVMFKERLKF